MKNAIMFHGSGETPNSFWYPGIKRYLEELGYEVWAPQLPKPDAPELKVQLPYVLENGRCDEETVLVGHSAGCPLILSVLQNINIRVFRAVLVAGFSRKLRGYPNPILQDRYDWEKIKRNIRDVILINSDNDPWGADDKQGYHMFKNLGGTLIIRQGEGHMGSKLYNQPYEEFPLLEKLLSLEKV